MCPPFVILSDPTPFVFIELEIEWLQIRLAVAEMIHFLRQVQAYCQLEVVECQWKELMEFINKKEGDLDALIAAHGDYVKRVADKLLLKHPKPGKEVCASSTLSGCSFLNKCLQ